MVENIVEKKRQYWLQAFCSFSSNIFIKAYFHGHENLGLGGKGLRIKYKELNPLVENR